jgi:hypothetical protein
MHSFYLTTSGRDDIKNRKHKHMGAIITISMMVIGGPIILWYEMRTWQQEVAENKEE